MINQKKIILTLGLVLVLVFTFSQGQAAQKSSILTLSYRGINDWDPSVQYYYGVQVLCNIYDQLLKYEDGKFIPVLATSYEKSAGGKVWTFKLRKGIKFHNGEPFNAEAVKYSYSRMLKMNQGPAGVFLALEKVDVIDEFTVQFVGKYPLAMDILVSQPFGSYIIPPKLTEEKGHEWYQKGNAVGTGPYKLVSWEKGVQVILEKNEDYWQGWKPNKFDKVIFKRVEEASTRIQLLKGGGLDFDEQGVSMNLLPGLKHQQDLEIVSAPVWASVVSVLNTKKPPTDDINVRKAILHAINYQQLADQLWGETAVLNRLPLPKSMHYHAAGLKPYGYDLKKAKALLKQSKYADQLAKGPMKLTMAKYDPEVDETVLYLQAVLKKIGFDVEIDSTPWPGIWDKLKNKKTAPNMLTAINRHYQDSPQEIFNICFTTKTDADNLWNFAYYSNPTFDKYFAEATVLEATDRPKAKAIYKKAQQLLLDDAVWAFMLDINKIVIKNKAVRGFTLNPAYPENVYVYELYHE
jgi:peptide/nickel transport system substrate-binding protein